MAKGRRPGPVSEAQRAREAARNRALEKKYAKLQAARDRTAQAEERADKKLAAKRRRQADKFREGLKAKARVKLLRPFLRGFEADDGFNLRESGEWTKRQRDKIELAYLKLAPFVLKPHVRVPAPTKRKLASLAEFTGLARPLRGMKAVPVVTPSPERTKVEVTDDGVVQVRAGRMLQRHFFIPERLEDEPRADVIARKMLANLPAGFYFIKTGEHEAYNNRVAHDPSVPVRDNLLLREVARFVSFYGVERVSNFFRGFRWIATLDNEEQAERESEKFIRARQAMNDERAARRREMSQVSRRRARRIIRG